MSAATAPTTEIQLSKRKLAYWLLFVVVIIGGSVYLFSQAEHITLNNVYNPSLVRLISGAGAVLFIALGALLARKLTDKLPGLVLSTDGFINNSTGATAGLVAWRDVVGLQEVSIGFSKLLAVKLLDPAAYINQQPNKMTRHVLENNLRTYGSPVLLSASNLECTFEELQALFAQRLAVYQATKPAAERK